MRGISQKELLEINPWQYDNQQDLLNHILEQCQELSRWMTLEEFLRSGFEGRCWAFTENDLIEALYDNSGFWYVCRYINKETILNVMPISKPEPPR